MSSLAGVREPVIQSRWCLTTYTPGLQGDHRHVNISFKPSDRFAAGPFTLG